MGVFQQPVGIKFCGFDYYVPWGHQAMTNVKRMEKK
jgi:hypothetical protein